MIPIEEIPPPKPAPDPSLVETRLLSQEEILKYVKPVYDQGGYSLPDPSTSAFVGTVRGGEVVGFLGLQVMLHAEPLWIKDGEANHLIPLVHKAEQIILERTGPQWVYVFAPPGKVARIAEHMGLRMEPWCVYSKLVMPNTPPKPMATLLDPEGDEPVEGIIQ